MRHELVAGDPDSRHGRIFEQWMRGVAAMLDGFHRYVPDYKPFDEPEVASVSVLVGAAAMAGYFPIAEAFLSKTSVEGETWDGRSDLWMIVDDQSYSFEFKKAPESASSSRLSRCLADALKCADCMPSEESDFFFGGVIAPVSDADEYAQYREFAGAQFSFWVGDVATRQGIFLFLDECADDSLDEA